MMQNIYFRRKFVSHCESFYDRFMSDKLMYDKYQQKRKELAKASVLSSFLTVCPFTKVLCQTNQYLININIKRKELSLESSIIIGCSVFMILSQTKISKLM